MGDRANVCIKSKSRDEPPVFLYTHWGGEELPRTVAAGLTRGRARWGDTPYLARILFCELVQHHVMGETGFGISAAVQDNEHPILVVDDAARTVGLAREWTPTEPYAAVSYETFVENPGALPWGDDPPPPPAEPPAEPPKARDPLEVALLRLLLETQGVAWTATQIQDYLANESAVVRGEDDPGRAARLASATAEAGNFAAEMKVRGL